MRTSAVTAKLIAATLTAASVVGAIFPAAAQQAFSQQQCRDAQVIGNAIMQRYAISDRLAGSYRRFIGSGCDMNTDWELVTPVDQQAFGEYRIRLVALRTADARGSKALTN